jgi:hypothetical protein
MRKLLICGMLLGLLSTVSFAQRGAARMPTAGPISHSTTLSPNAVGNIHDGVVPNAAAKSPSHVMTGSSADPVAPNAKTGSPNADTVKPDATNVPRAVTPTVTMPDAHTGPGPDVR